MEGRKAEFGDLGTVLNFQKKNYLKAYIGVEGAVLGYLTGNCLEGVTIATVVIDYCFTYCSCQKGDGLLGDILETFGTELGFKEAALDCLFGDCWVKTAVRNVHVQQLGFMRSARGYSPFSKGKGDWFLLTCLFEFCRDWVRSLKYCLKTLCPTIEVTCQHDISLHHVSRDLNEKIQEWRFSISLQGIAQ